MILKLNHMRGDTAATTQDVTAALYALLEEGRIRQDQFERLRVQLDWIQYKQSFRQVVTAAPVDPEPGEPAPGQTPPPFLDLYVDTRQIVPGTTDLRCEIFEAIRHATGAVPENSADGRLYLEDFTSYRTSVAWAFNSLYWSRLDEWEKATGKGYEQALPGGILRRQPSRWRGR